MAKDVNNIERDFLLREVLMQKKTLRVHGEAFTTPGLISKITKENICIEVAPHTVPLVTVFERITVYFDFSTSTYMFNATVQKTDSKYIYADIPLKITKSLERKYVRIKNPQHITALFHLANEEIKLDYPVCDEYTNVGEICPDTNFDLSNIANLMNDFKRGLQGQATNASVIMFRKRQPESMEEKMITQTGKTLYIPSTSSPLPKQDPYPEGRIITESIEETFEDPDYFINGSEFERCLQKKKDEHINSEIWSPIIYYQYVVGYVYVFNKGPEAVSFDINILDYTIEFSRVLAFFLKKTGYFHDTENTVAPTKHTAQILDMTPDGMLMTIPNKEIHAPIKEGTVFSIALRLNDTEISCSGKVARRYEKDNNICYGLSFTNISPKDVLCLHEFLYQRPYSDNDSFVMEQVQLTGFER